MMLQMRLADFIEGNDLILSAWPGKCQSKNPACERAAVSAPSIRLARISHGPVRNAHGVPIRHWRIGASREGFRPGKLLPKQLATADLFIRPWPDEKVTLKFV